MEIREGKNVVCVTQIPACFSIKFRCVFGALPFSRFAPSTHDIFMVPGAYDALRQQAANDADLTLRALGIQLLINLLVSIIILICISWLRPRHKLVCVSRSATFTSTK